MHSLPSVYPSMLYVGAGLTLVVVAIVLVTWFRHVMLMQSITLLGREIAASETNEVEHVRCDCCHRHGKTLRYSFNRKEAWVCMSCNKRLRAFLNGQPKSIKNSDSPRVRSR